LAAWDATSYCSWTTRDRHHVEWTQDFPRCRRIVRAVTQTAAAWVILASGVFILGLTATTMLTKGRAPNSRVDPAVRMRSIPIQLALGGGMVVESVPTLLHMPSVVVLIAAPVGATSIVLGGVLALRARSAQSRNGES
jgi:hypothetical protein